MNRITHLIILVIALLFSTSTSTAQDKIFLDIDSIANRLTQQLVLFPQEKIYIHTDKSQYISGEKIWFRIHLVDAVYHQKAIASKYAYVELINPLDSIISRVKTKIDNNGIHAGYMLLSEDIIAGEYTLQASTNYMNNLDSDYFFKKRIEINDPSRSFIQPQITFEHESENKVRAKISFYDTANDDLIIPENAKISLNDGVANRLKFNDNKTAQSNLKLNKKNENNVVNIEFVKDKRLGKYYIPIPDSEKDFEVSFFPEGGYLIDETNSSIAFKAINKNGTSEYITGEVFDEKNNFITDLKTLHEGMGVFTLTPQKNKNYYAVCRNTHNIEKRIDLPPVMDNTYTIKAVWKEHNLLLSVNKPGTLSRTIPLNLLIHCRGQLLYFSEWDFSNEIMTLPQNMLSTGVLQILLLDNELNPLSERLVFCQNTNQTKTKFQTDQNNYKTRQKVSALMQVRNSKNNPISGNFSVSVTDNQDILPHTTNNILTSLLLTSDIKGFIENPSFYFNPNSRQASKALDILMMTQGWRRYDIPNSLKGNYQTPNILFGEDGQIKGYVKGYWRGKPVGNSNVSIASFDPLYMNMTTTNSDGLFNFGDLEYPDSTRFVIQALNQKGKDGVELDVKEELYSATAKHLPFSNHDKTKSSDNKIENYVKKADLKYIYENGNRMVYLDEVEVRALSPDKEKENNSLYSRLSSKRFTSKEIENALKIDVLLGQVAGLRVSTIQKEGEPRRKVALIRNAMSFSKGYVPAMIIIDDVIMEFFDLDDIILNDIEQIDILKGNQAAILGSSGMGGAIVITTKKGSNKTGAIKKFNIKTIYPLGFQKPAEFYSPKYEAKKQINDKTPDLRTTVFWKPDVIVSEKGEANFEFYTADSENTEYSVVIEGVTDEGEIIHTIEKISVK